MNKNTNPNTTEVIEQNVTNLTTTHDNNSVAYTPTTFSLDNLAPQGKKYPSICTIQGATAEEQIKIMNAITDCDEDISENIGEELKLTGFFIEEVESENTDELTGEVTTRSFPRTILFTQDGKAYAGGSIGIYNALSNLTRVFGMPQNWKDGVITIKIKQIKKGSGDTQKNINTFKVVSVGA